MDLRDPDRDIQFGRSQSAYSRVARDVAAIPGHSVRTENLSALSPLKAEDHRPCPIAFSAPAARHEVPASFAKRPLQRSQITAEESGCPASTLAINPSSDH